MKKHLELLQRIADRYHQDLDVVGDGRPAPDALIRTYCHILNMIIKIKEELASKSVLNE